jgi:hypothetical protein
MLERDELQRSFALLQGANLGSVDLRASITTATYIDGVPQESGVS